MALVERINPITVPASGDLSSHLGKFVAVDSNGNAVLASVLGQHVLGVLQNKPTALGQAAEVAVVGSVAKVIAGASITAGAKVTTTAAGLAQTAVSTQTVVGTAMASAVLNDLVPVLLDNEGVLA